MRSGTAIYDFRLSELNYPLKLSKLWGPLQYSDPQGFIPIQHTITVELTGMRQEDLGKIIKELAEAGYIEMAGTNPVSGKVRIL